MEEQMRLEALRMAERYCSQRTDYSPDDIVAFAAKFYAYIIGATPGGRPARHSSELPEDLRIAFAPGVEGE